jgi:Fe-S cluster assembly protein SufD
MNAAPTLTQAATARFVARAGSDKAARAFRACGLPTNREEAWHYTQLRPLLDIAFADAPVSSGTDALALLPSFDAPRAVFVNGLAASGRVPDIANIAAGDKLDALNAMLARDGVVIDVPEGEDAGTFLLGSVGDAAADTPISFHPRHRISLGAGARLTLIEVSTGTGRYLHNPAFSISLAAGATLTHLRLQNEDTEAFHLSTLHVDVAADATYDSFALTLGARLARMQVEARLTGPNATVHLNAAQLLTGQQHADFTTIVHHEAPSCASRQTVKNVLAGESHGVFQGKIDVTRAAQKTDGYQMNQALLLSPDAEMDSKPELQIYADDVKCSHGATVGALDADQMFYLRSRGVPEPEARAMLVRAFLAEALDPISHVAGRALLEDAAAGWWSRQ